MNIPHDSSCHEGFKNVSFIQVRNLEGQNHPGHTVFMDVGQTRDNYSKQRPDIENLFTHPWSVSIRKTAIFVFKLLSFYVE